jgi:DNA-binding transcriptional LysR family regulator
MARDSSLPLKHPLSLRYFYEVAQAGSFRKASDQVHVAASALNRHVKHLEDEMGTLLFERGRGRGGLKLTAAGEIFLYRLKRAMSELGTARTEVDALIGLKRGTVNFGVNEGIWREILPQLLAGFRKAHPGIDYHVVVGTSPRLVEALLQDEIDFALAFNPPPQAGVHFAVRRNIEACVMAPRGHPLAAKRAVRLGDCAEYELVMPDASLALRATLDRMFAQAGVVPRTVLTTNSYEIMRTAAESGVGIAILTQQVFSAAGSKSPVVYIPLRDASIAPQLLACCTRSGRTLPAASTAMIAAFEKALPRKA